MQVKQGEGLEMLSFAAIWDRCLPHFLSQKLCGDNAEIAQKCLSIFPLQFLLARKFCEIFVQRFKTSDFEKVECQSIAQPC